MLLKGFVGLMRCCHADHGYSWMFGALQVPGLKPPVVAKEVRMEAVAWWFGKWETPVTEKAAGLRLRAPGGKLLLHLQDLQLGNRVSALAVLSTRAGRAQAPHQEGQGQQPDGHGYRWREQGKKQYAERYLQVRFYMHQKPCDLKQQNDVFLCC